MCNNSRRPPLLLCELIRLAIENHERDQKPSVEEAFVITQEHIKLSIALAHDTNRVHSDESFSKRSGFKDVIVPGLFLGMRISGLVGRNFPDGILADSIQLKFRRPCYVGNTVTLRLWFAGIRQGVCGNENISLDFSVKNQDGKLVADGSCVVVLRPEDGK